MYNFFDGSIVIYTYPYIENTVNMILFKVNPYVSQRKPTCETRCVSLVHDFHTFTARSITSSLVMKTLTSLLGFG